MELRRRGYEVFVGRVGKAVDFVARRQSEVIYVQVSVTIAASEETRRREYAPFGGNRGQLPEVRRDSGSVFG